MSTALTTTAKKDIRTLIQSDAVKQQLALVLPKHLTADRMARVALTSIMKTPKLGLCSPESLLQALMLCSQAGLEPDGRNAHLIPYGDQVQVIFDWKGLVSLAKRNGIQNIAAEIVCENDTFEWHRDGEGLHFKHRIEFRKPRGNMFAAYCIWKDGSQFDGEVMTIEEVEGIRKRSRAGNAGPWVTDFNEMAKKTVIRRASKKWPLDSEVAEAMNDADSPVLPTVNVPDAPSFSPKVIELAGVIGDPQDGDLAPAPSPATPKEKKPTPKAPPEPPVKPQDEPAAPELIPAPEPVQEAYKAAYTPAAGTLGDLLAAMESEGVSTDQILRFAGKKGVLKEGTDLDLAVMVDILESKIPVLAKMIRTKGTALKEMKEG